jgi:hypothetical protein
MSSFLSQDDKGNYIHELESLDICKWKINEICCNDKSQYIADYPSPFCKCESIEDCKYFEKEDMKWIKK